MTVEELLSRVSSRELTEWGLYYELEPFGEWRADLRMGIQTAAQVNSVPRNKKERHKAWKPEDFMPDFERDARKGPNQDVLFEKVKMLSAVFGGTIEDEPE